MSETPAQTIRRAAERDLPDSSGSIHPALKVARAYLGVAA